MLQDIAPKKLDNQYKPSAEPTDESVVFVFKDRNVLVRQDEGKLFPTFVQLGRPEGCVYLFTIGKKAFFLLLGDAEPVIPDNFDFEPIKTGLAHVPPLAAQMTIKIAMGFVSDRLTRISDVLSLSLSLSLSLFYRTVGKHRH